MGFHTRTPKFYASHHLCIPTNARADQSTLLEQMYANAHFRQDLRLTSRRANPSSAVRKLKREVHRQTLFCRMDYQNGSV